MSITVELHQANDAYGVCAIDAEVIIFHSPREGFDNEKLCALERELSALISERLNGAIKNRGGAA